MDPITAVSPAAARARVARNFQADLIDRDACPEGRAWAKANKIKSPAEAWAKLERPDWMFWLADSYRIELRESDLVQLAATWADRALHVHAPAALRSAGLPEQAAKLEALPPLAGKASSELRAARAAAWAARAAAWAASDAARAASDAAWAASDAAWAASDAAWAARAAAWAARAAAWAARAAARAARAAARAAAWAASDAAWAAESECQCRELRAVGPSLPY
jgi:hypothetical protein